MHIAPFAAISGVLDDMFLPEIIPVAHHLRRGTKHRLKGRGRYTPNVLRILRGIKGVGRPVPGAGYCYPRGTA